MISAGARITAVISSTFIFLCLCLTLNLEQKDKTQDWELRDISEMILKFLYTSDTVNQNINHLQIWKTFFAVYREVGGFTYTSMHCLQNSLRTGKNIHLFIMKRRMNTVAAGGVIFDETALFLIEYNLRGGTTWSTSILSLLTVREVGWYVVVMWAVNININITNPNRWMWLSDLTSTFIGKIRITTDTTNNR